jgi:hypothetical protein
MPAGANGVELAAPPAGGGVAVAVRLADEGMRASGTGGAFAANGGAAAAGAEAAVGADVVAGAGVQKSLIFEIHLELTAYIVHGRLHMTYHHDR